MEEKKPINTFSTGGGGDNFQSQVGSYFVALMLVDGVGPYMSNLPILEIKFQTKKLGYHTDDILVIAGENDGTRRVRLLGQVKHSVNFTNNPVFGAVIRDALVDFRNENIFHQKNDLIALMTGPLSKTDIDHVRPLLRLARSIITADEFFNTVEMANVCSNTQRNKLKTFQHHLDNADGGRVSKEEVHAFLRHFHLIGFDLDDENAVARANIYTILKNYSISNPSGIRARIREEVAYANQNGRTITKENLPHDITDAFAVRDHQDMPASIAEIVVPGDLRDWKSPAFSGALAVANLIGYWNDGMEADLTIARKLYNGPFDEWTEKCRQVINLPESPLRIHNRTWSVRDRLLLWKSLGKAVFDNHLAALQECAVSVLLESDPSFELAQEDRFAARLYGKNLTYSGSVRKGLAESLALVGSKPEYLTNCSEESLSGIAHRAVQRLLDGADWIRWGSLDGLIPDLAEAAPDAFMTAVETSLSADPCPFDRLFAEEGEGVTGANYVTGLLWALEGLAWDAKHFVRVIHILGRLAKRDPGGNWANRPKNSLVNVFLPWLPQTTAPIEKRIMAIRSLHKTAKDVTWELLLNLLPDRHISSSGTHRPKWRDVIPTDWKKGVGNQEYWDQVNQYGRLIVEFSEGDADRTSQLIGYLGNMPLEARDALLKRLESKEFEGALARARQTIWESLSEFTKKHRRFTDAKWALPDGELDKIEAVASRIAPSDVREVNRRIFIENEWDLYEDSGDYEEQRQKLEKRRQDVIREIIKLFGFDGLVEFATSVDSPSRAGLSLGAIEDQNFDENVLPGMIVSERKSDQEFARGYVWNRQRTKGWDWVDGAISKNCTPEQIGQTLACLPFSLANWERVSRLLGDDEAKYWSCVSVNPYHAGGDLSFAIDKLIEHGRPWTAIGCLDAMLHAKKLPFDRERAIRALMAAADSSEQNPTNSAIEVIEALQSDPGTDPDELLKIEWIYFELLDRRGSAYPKALEQRLASDPSFFCELIRCIYRSRKEGQAKNEPTEAERAAAKRARRLLHNWQTVPGRTPEGEFSGQAFENWVASVIDSAKESGHLKAALQHVGNVLVNPPADPDGLYMHRSIAKILDAPENEEMRSGLFMAILNSRGVHHEDPSAELELARIHRAKAESLELAGFVQVAVELNRVAEYYEAEAKRFTERHRSVNEDGSEEQEDSDD